MTNSTRPKKPKKWKAWLITWESVRQGELEEIQRSRIVAILKPQISSRTITNLLPVLYMSELRLNFSEKIGHGLHKSHDRALWHESGVIYYDSRPLLTARLVDDLYVEIFPDTIYHQKLHWTERPLYRRVGSSFRFEIAVPARQESEDVEFDRLWYGISYLEEDRKRGTVD